MIMTFDETTHTYTRNGSEYISVTQLLSRYKLSADYANIPASILEQAADRGKAIHGELELYIKGMTTPPGTNSPVDLLHKYVVLSNIDLTQAKSEQIYYDDNYKIAGTVDFQYYNDAKELVIADFKTTSQIHFDAVAWQLSIYNYLICNGDIMQYYFNKLQVFHIKDGKLKVKEINTIDYDILVALFEALKENKPDFTYVKDISNILSDTNSKLLKQILEEENTYKQGLEKLKEEKEEILNAVKEKLIKSKQYRIVTDDLTITYVDGVTRKSLNTTLVKKVLQDNGFDLDNFYNTTKGKDGVKVTLAKKND